MGKRNQLFDGVKNIGNHPVGGGGIVASYEFPNVLKINRGFRVKVIVLAH